MSKDSVENKLDILIFLLENLPSKIADEMEKRHEIREKLQVEAEIEFYSEHQDEINKFMYGFKKNIEVDDNNGRAQPLEKAVKRKA